MQNEKLKKIGEEWKALDEKYDDSILELIDAAETSSLTPERMGELKAMQDRLFDLEVEIFEILGK